MQHKSVTVKKQHKGYVVETFPGKKGADKHTHVVSDMAGVIKLVRNHLDQILANDMDGVSNYFPPGKIKKE